MKILRIILCVAGIAAVFCLKGVRLNNQIQRNNSYQSSSYSYKKTPSKEEELLKKIDELKRNANYEKSAFCSLAENSSSDREKVERAKKDIDWTLSLYKSKVMEVQSITKSSRVSSQCDSELLAIASMKEEIDNLYRNYNSYSEYDDDDDDYSYSDDDDYSYSDDDDYSYSDDDDYSYSDDDDYDDDERYGDDSDDESDYSYNY